MNVPQEVKEAGRSAIDTYRESIKSGASEKFAIMCALQIAPGTKGSDRAFMEGRLNNQQLDQLPKRMASYMVKEANAAGINVSGKHYVGGIADKRCWRDPEAWVSSVDDVKRVAVKRNLHVSGAVEHEGIACPPRRVALSERIIKEEVAREKKRNPKAKAGELREKVIERHALKRKL
jgi:hypothetical protein